MVLVLMAAPLTDHQRGGKLFPQTRWSLVLDAQRRDGADADVARRAMGELCQSYWVPLYTYVRRSGYTEHDAEDHTQEFFRRVIAKDYIRNVAEHKGRLRSFFLSSIKHFLLDEAKYRNAEKRGGGQVPLSIDRELGESRYHTEPSNLISPEQIFERQWALSVMDSALDSLEAEYGNDGREVIFATLSPYLQWNSGEKTYAEIGGALAMTEGAVKVAVFRLRKRYRHLLRVHVAETLSDEEDVDIELRRMLSLFGSPT